MQCPGASAFETARREVDVRFEQAPVGGAPRAMMRDARGEFGVAGDACRRDVGDGQRALTGELFRVHALAGARAADDEGEVAGNHRVIVPACSAGRRDG